MKTVYRASPPQRHAWCEQIPRTGAGGACDLLFGSCSFLYLLPDDADDFRGDHARLDDVSIGAQLLRLCPLGIIALIGERYEDSRGSEALVGDRLQEGKTVLLRHDEVEDDAVGRKASPQSLESI